jgi:osmotically-inducible protein OsmY
LKATTPLKKKVAASVPRFLAVLAVSAFAGAGCATTAPIATAQVDSTEILALKRDLSRDARFSRITRVTVDPASGAVTLAGEVSSNADRADAGRLASSVPGVVFVYNEIEVHRSPR